jgi:peptidoglycan L-alanyl-D-glutamate endopeptidase CwlK
MGNVSGVSGNSKTEIVSFNATEPIENKTNDTTGNLGFRSQTAGERILFNQADVTRANLQAQAVPRLNAASEARLAEINPQLANRIRAMAADLRAQGINVMVTSGYRSFAEQNALYAQGRTKPGNIVTNARGGQSLHNYGLAVDVVPIGANGQPNWNVPNSTWQKIGAAGKRQGMEWGGDWTSFVDRPHFQMTAGRSISSLLGQYNRNGGNLHEIWNDVNRSYPNVGGTTVPTTPNTPTNPPSNTLRAGSRGEKVVQLQRDLARLGYALTPDGVFGPKTDAAVRRFQRDHNLTADGIVGPKTRAAIERVKNNAALPVPTATLQKGSRGAQVKQLQNALAWLGFMTRAQIKTGPGIFGPRTDEALRDFQRRNNLAADGIYGPKTRAALKNALG